MATNTGISSQTAAGNFSVTVLDGASIQVWTSPVLPAGESVAVYRTDGGSVEEKVIENGKAIGLSRECPSVALNGPATFKFYKSATATATAVYYDS